jgi:hypothetical protein
MSSSRANSSENSPSEEEQNNAEWLDLNDIYDDVPGSDRHEDGNDDGLSAGQFTPRYRDGGKHRPRTSAMMLLEYPELTQLEQNKSGVGQKNRSNSNREERRGRSGNKNDKTGGDVGGDDKNAYRHSITLFPSVAKQKRDVFGGDDKDVSDEGVDDNDNKVRSRSGSRRRKSSKNYSPLKEKSLKEKIKEQTKSAEAGKAVGAAGGPADDGTSEDKAVSPEGLVSANIYNVVNYDIEALVNNIFWIIANCLVCPLEIIAAFMTLYFRFPKLFGVSPASDSSSSATTGEPSDSTSAVTGVESSVDANADPSQPVSAKDSAVIAAVENADPNTGQLHGPLNTSWSFSPFPNLFGLYQVGFLGWFFILIIVYLIVVAFWSLKLGRLRDIVLKKCDIRLNHCLEAAVQVRGLKMLCWDFLYLRDSLLPARAAELAEQLKRAWYSAYVSILADSFPNVLLLTTLYFYIFGGLSDEEAGDAKSGKIGLQMALKMS